jgi:hypothetical protein
MLRTLNSLKSSAFTLAACLLLMGCAPHRPVQNDLATGHIGHAIWPCTVNAKAGVIDCECAHFVMSVNAKTGTTVLHCPKNGAQ